MSADNLTDWTLPGETWLPVVGYEGWYEVSDLGRIRSLDWIVRFRCRTHNQETVRRKRRRILNQQFRPIARGSLTRYKHVNLCVFSAKKTYLTHRLIVSAFIRPIEAGEEVNHKNGNGIDNRPSNLEIVTSSENKFHAFRVLGRRSCFGESHRSAKLTESSVRQIRFRLEKMPFGNKTFTVLATEYGVTRNTIKAIATGRTWRHIA